MKMQPQFFEKIKNNNKTVEIRLFDEKRKALRIGEQIEFSKQPELREKILVEIIELRKFPDFVSLLNEYSLSEMGFAETISQKDFLQTFYQYYTPEEEKMFGVIAIKVKLL